MGDTDSYQVFLFVFLGREQLREINSYVATEGRQHTSKWRKTIKKVGMKNPF